MEKIDEILDKEIGILCSCTISNGELARCAVIDSEIWEGFMDGTVLRDTRWDKALFERDFMDNAVFKNMSMKNAWFHLTNLKNSTVSNLSMEGSKFTDMTMSKCLIERCDLKNTKIVSSDLKGVEISDCGYDDMTIEGVPVRKLIEAYNQLNPDNPLITNENK